MEEKAMKEARTSRKNTETAEVTAKGAARDCACGAPESAREMKEAFREAAGCIGDVHGRHAFYKGLSGFAGALGEKQAALMALDASREKARFVEGLDGTASALEGASAISCPPRAFLDEAGRLAGSARSLASEGASPGGRQAFLEELGAFCGACSEASQEGLLEELTALMGDDGFVPGSWPTCAEAEDMIAAADAMGEKTVEVKKAVNCLLMGFYHSEDPGCKRWGSDTFIMRNAGFIGRMIDKSFCTFKQQHYDDMFNCGVVAMLENMDRFDPSRSETGSATTFFTYPILNKISEYVNGVTNGGGSYRSGLMNKVRKTIQQLRNEGTQDPTQFQIAVASGMPSAQVGNALQFINYSDFFYLDEVEDNDSLLKDDSDPVAVVINNETMRIVREGIMRIPDSDARKCILLKFGFCGGEPMSEQEISRKTGFPASKVCTLTNRALEYLKSDAAVSGLKGTPGKLPKEEDENAVYDTDFVADEMYASIEDSSIPDAKAKTVSVAMRH